MKSVRNWQIGRVSSSIRTTPDLMSHCTRQKLVQLGWDVLPHPPYSPDLAPSDYHLFRSLQNSLNEKNFDSLEAYKNHLAHHRLERCQVLEE